MNNNRIRNFIHAHRRDLLLFGFSLIVAFTSEGCPTAVEPGIEPPMPVFVSQSKPPDAEDTGIFADLGNTPRAIILQWHPDTVSLRTTGYRIFRSNDSDVDGSGMLTHGTLLSSFESAFPYPVDTTYRDTLGLAIGPTYYYQVQAFNRSATNRITYGRPTHVGHSTSFQLLSELTADSPKGIKQVGVMGLSFSFSITGSSLQGGSFQIIVRNVNGTTMWSSGETQLFGTFSESYPTNTTIAKPLIQGETYQWRVKQLGDNAGSSSIWQNFGVIY